MRRQSNVSILKIDVHHSFGGSQRKANAASDGDVARVGVFSERRIVVFVVRIGVTCSQAPTHAIDISCAIWSVDVFYAERKFLAIAERIGFTVVARFGKFLQRVVECQRQFAIVGVRNACAIERWQIEQRAAIHRNRVGTDGLLGVIAIEFRFVIVHKT